MELKLGRNEPCHCGSGKKYKKCHLPLDEQQSALEREARRKEEESEETPLKLDEVPTLLEALARTVPDSERAEFEQLSSQLGPLLEYQKRQPEIEAASKALEPHREEFLKLAKQERPYLARVEKLFAEPRYAPLRFTAEEVRGALGKAGVDYRAGLNKDAAPMLRKAILFLADKERRTQMAMHLALSLPELVDAERYLDGWVVQSCAQMTTEDQDEPNPFLFEMFSHGYDAILEQDKAGDDVILGELGLNRAQVEKMAPAEINALCASFYNDPAKLAKIESVFSGRLAREEAIALTERLDKQVLDWLSGDEAKPLLLESAEVEPYVSLLAERWAQRMEGKASQPQEEDVTQTIWPVVAEMAQHVFTPERKEQLIKKGMECADQLFLRGEKGISGALSATLARLQTLQPESDSFVTSLCFISLRGYLNEFPGSTGAEPSASV